MLTLHDDQIKAIPASAFGIRAVISKTDGMSKLMDCLHGLFGSGQVLPADSVSDSSGEKSSPSKQKSNGEKDQF
jgi:DNA-binding NarL/FixJ family response regulator